MIKLKQLIKEIVTENEVIAGVSSWNTPEDTPEAVIDVLHLLSAKFLKEGKNPREYFSLVARELPVFGKHWMIRNRKNHNKSLVYSPSANQWFLPGVGPDISMYFSPKMLNALIRRW